MNKVKRFVLVLIFLVTTLAVVAMSINWLHPSLYIRVESTSGGGDSLFVLKDYQLTISWHSRLGSLLPDQKTETSKKIILTSAQQKQIIDLLNQYNVLTITSQDFSKDPRIPDAWVDEIKVRIPSRGTNLFTCASGAPDSSTGFRCAQFAEALTKVFYEMSRHSSPS